MLKNKKKLKIKKKRVRIIKKWVVDVDIVEIIYTR
jgi:hypothetical protein